MDMTYGTQQMNDLDSQALSGQQVISAADDSDKNCSRGTPQVRREVSQTEEQFEQKVPNLESEKTARVEPNSVSPKVDAEPAA